MRKPKPGAMASAASVIVVGVDPRGMGLIQECLGAEAILHGESLSYEEASDVARRVRPHVVIAGLDRNLELALALGGELRQSLADTQLIAYSSHAEPTAIRSAMRHGYREFVVLPDDAEILRKAVREAAYSLDVEEEAGRIIAINGTKGGSGVTLLTTNLAAELSPVQRVIALDLDFAMGDVAPFLDLTVQATIQDVMRNAHRLDDRMLGGSVVVHPSKVHVLAQPHEPIAPEEITEGAILALLRGCAKAYQYILADCGCRGDLAALTTMTVADLIILVCTPDVPAVRNAWRRLRFLERNGVEKDRIRLVVNRWMRNAPISLKDIRENLGMEIAATIANDSRTALVAVNDGRLLRDVNRRSPAARDIARMVELATEERRQIDTLDDTSLIGRLLS